jgi:hypothetical protein
MTADWPWYEVVTGEALDQGDIVPACPVLIAVELAGTQVMPTARLSPITALVVTQTCDLVQEKTDSVIVCAMWSVGQVVLQDPTLRTKAEEACTKEKLGPLPSETSKTLDAEVERIVEKSGPLRNHFNAIIKGERPAYAMLAEHPASGSPRWVVSFQHVYAMPKGVVSRAALDAGSRLRLRPPYREHVSAAFGRFFARIGLPVDIVQYKSKAV